MRRWQSAAYALDVAGEGSALPVAQQTVLRMRAEALPIEEIASRLGVTAKSAESLLSRGRRTMRAVAAGLQAVFIAVLFRPRGRRGTGKAVGALAATSAAAAFAFLVATPTPATGAAALWGDPPFRWTWCGTPRRYTRRMGRTHARGLADRLSLGRRQAAPGGCACTPGRLMYAGDR